MLMSGGLHVDRCTRDISGITYPMQSRQLEIVVLHKREPHPPVCVKQRMARVADGNSMEEMTGNLLE
jgi:hypothetical protein